jgi:hypothetical protein
MTEKLDSKETLSLQQRVLVNKSLSLTTPSRKAVCVGSKESGQVQEIAKGRF